MRALEARVAAVESRFAALETGVAAVAAGAARQEQLAASLPPEPVIAGVAAAVSAVAVLTLIGRTLVVLGGAFLLRAVTEAGAVPQVAGTVAGLAYGLLWLLLADRAAARLLQTSAAFHGFAGAVIAFPLIAEATLKFRFLAPSWSAVALTATFALGLGVAWRRRLLGLAWVMTLGSVATALGMAFASRVFFPFVGSLIVLGAATLALAYLRGWAMLAGFVAAIANLMVLVVTVARVIASHPAAPRALTVPRLLLLQCGLVVVYFGGLAWRSLRRRHDLALFEIAQGVFVFGIGFGGATALVRASGELGALVGTVALVLGACSYAATFTFIDRRQGRRINFLFYSTLALALTLIGLSTLFTAATRPVMCAVASLCTAWIGNRRQRATLSGHGAFYAVAAGIGSGLLPAGLATFFGNSFTPVRWFTAPAVIVLAVTVANCWLEVAKHGRTWGRLSPVPKLVILCCLCAELGGILVSAVVRSAHIGAGETVDVQALAAIRTGVLALSALALAALSRAQRLAEAFWLVYPVLVLAGAKLLVEDLRHGRAATVFASLVLYGIALIVAPRLARRRRG